MTLRAVAEELERWNTDAAQGALDGEMAARLGRIAEELKRLQLPGPATPGVREDAALLARECATASRLIGHGLGLFEAWASVLAPAGYGPAGTRDLPALGRAVSVAGRAVSIAGRAVSIEG
jgi:hypothetical protein